MKKYKEVTETITKKVVSEMHCNCCGKEIFMQKEDHFDENGATEKSHDDYQKLEGHGISVKVTGGYYNKILADLSVQYFDLCEKCLTDFMASFKIPALQGGYSPLPFMDTSDKEEDLA